MSKLLLPQGARMVHIGPQKTGSTAIQEALATTRGELHDHGVVYPGTTVRNREAGWAVLGRGAPRGKPRPRPAAWEDLVREVGRAGEARVCISNEAFGRADAEAARRIVDGLGGERAHIVAVVRRLDRLLPSQWQERVKARESLAYENWLRVVLEQPEDPRAERVWVPHDVEALVERWLTVVPAERFTLIVADEEDRALLPRTFEQMLGLPDRMIGQALQPSNQSLDMSETELLRRMNEIFDDRGWSDGIYREFVQRGLVRRLKDLPRQPGSVAPPSLPSWAWERVARLSDERAAAVARLPVRVVGDPDRLRLPSQPTRTGGPTSQQPVMSIDAAACAVEAAVARGIRRERAQRRAHRHQVGRLRRDVGSAGAERPRGAVARRIRRLVLRRDR